MTKLTITAEQYSNIIELLKQRNGTTEADIIRACNMSRGISCYWKNTAYLVLPPLF